MRHRKNKLLLIRGSVQGRDLTMRTMLTNLIRYGHLTTTEKKSKVLIAYTNRFFAKLASMSANLEASVAQREIIRWTKSLVYGNDEGKKVVTEMLPTFIQKGLQTAFVTQVKLGKRIGDAAEEVRIEFIK